MAQWIQATPSTLAKIKSDIRDRLQKGIDDDMVIELENGIYSPDDFHFTKEDCHPSFHLTFKGNLHTVIDGGLTLTKDKWLPVPASHRDWFRGECVDNIRYVPLKEYGLNKEDWGTLCAIGAYHTQRKYPDFPTGKLCQMFCGKGNDLRRMNLARYPDGQFDRLDNVLDVGDCHEFPSQNYYEDWNTRINPRPGTYILSRETAARAKLWTHANDPWMFGFIYWDWADSSTPVTFIPDKRWVLPTFVSLYGARAGALVYYYNIPEELDTPNEWYLDRETGYLFFMPKEDDDTISFSWRDTPVVEMDHCQNLTFESIEITGTVGDGIVAQDCRNISLSRMFIHHIGCYGAVLNGFDNIITRSEIAHAGKGGVSLAGGDRATLTHGSNIVSNCKIHDFGEVYMTYCPGVLMMDVGQICSHNELYNSPHSAILYMGNEHLIEYNDIYHMVLHSSDAGAIYCGRDWAAHGTVTRYNRIQDIGSGEFRPNGIYWDDAENGQIAYGNILIGIPQLAFHIGGGREHIVKNNILIDCPTPISYDDRARDGFVHDGWYRKIKEPTDENWMSLTKVPYNEEPWKSRYPRIAQMLPITGDPDDIDFPCNPSYSVVTGNAIAHKDGRIGNISESAAHYSVIRDNTIVPEADSSWYEGRPNVPGFAPIPVDKIGIEKEKQ